MENIKTNIITNATEKRKQIKGLIDDFATFQWRGKDAWDEFGAFIINEGKGDLKFYNGPGFSNEYSTPMFSSSSGNLMGVNFKIQPIKFKIGMYWFTIDEYQKFIDWINPYKINYLSFGFKPNYGYLVKLAGISDSPRYVIGHNGSEPVYYTEMELSWEVQGENFVRSNISYEWETEANDAGDAKVITWTFDDEKKDLTERSLLDTPLVLEIPFDVTEEEAEIEFQVKIKEDSPISLFKVDMQNLKVGSESTNVYTPVKTMKIGNSYAIYENPNVEGPIDFKFKYSNKDCKRIVYQDSKLNIITESGGVFTSNFPFVFQALQTNVPSELEGYVFHVEETAGEAIEDMTRPSNFTIRYDSQSGLLFLQVGSQKTWRLLSYLTDTVTGDYIIKNLNAIKYYLPGQFTNRNFDMTDVEFILTAKGLSTSMIQNTLIIYSRKNVI